jgi:hypothetical protein
MQGSIPKTFPEYYLYWTFTQSKLLQSPLLTIDKKELKIISFGERNNSDGPDYQNAELIIDGIQLKGDIEFHLRWQDWYIHGHDKDRRYQGVILHVLWHPAKGLPKALRKRFPHLILSRHLRNSKQKWIKIMQSLETDHLHSRMFSVPEIPPLEEIKTLAWKRFSRKCEEIKFWVNSFNWETGLYIGIAKALGYSKNSDPFTTLIMQFPPAKLFQISHPLQRSSIDFWILLCHQAGLLDRPLNYYYYKNLSVFKIFKRIHEVFISKLNSHKLDILQWHFSSLRPLNNPYFRMAGYSQLLFFYQVNSLFKHLSDIFSLRLSYTDLVKRIEQSLIIKLSEDFYPIFSEFLGFSRMPIYTMGIQRCRLIFLNILLPFFYTQAQFTKSYGFQSYLEELFFQFPSVDNNSILKKIDPRGDHPYSRYAFFQQGLMELTKNSSSIKKTKIY